ncbi:hypothetical protein BGZ65_011877, partial [Modicella reniformis]
YRPTTRALAEGDSISNGSSRTATGANYRTGRHPKRKKPFPAFKWLSNGTTKDGTRAHKKHRALVLSGSTSNCNSKTFNLDTIERKLWPKIRRVPLPPSTSFLRPR